MPETIRQRYSCIKIRNAQDFSRTFFVANLYIVTINIRHNECMCQNKHCINDTCRNKPPFCARLTIRRRIRIFKGMRNSILNKQFRYSYWNASAVLAGINLLVFFLVNSNIYIRNYPLTYWLGLSRVFMVNFHAFWQFLTYMFVHQTFAHLFFNMLALVMFGLALERKIGSNEFLVFYLVCGLVSGAVSYLVYALTGTNILLYGASGAIYGLLFLFAVVFPDARLLLFFFIPMRAPVAVLVFALICVFEEIFMQTGVASLTHLAGMFVAWLYCLIRFRVSPVAIWKNSLRR